MSKRSQGTLDSFLFLTNKKSKNQHSNNENTNREINVVIEKPECDINREYVSQNTVVNLTETSKYLSNQETVASQNLAVKTVINDCGLLNENFGEPERDPAKGNQHDAIKSLTLNLGPFQPKNIDYPKKGNRKFRGDWFSEYKWLEYSPSSDSTYCFFL